MKFLTCLRFRSNRPRQRFLTLVVGLAAFGIYGSAFAQGSSRQSLEDVIQAVTQNSESFQAIDRSIESLEAEIRSRDLELGALFTADLSDTRDERITINGQRPIGHRQLLETSLIKPFSTGTNVELLLSHQIADLPALGDNNQIANWEVTIAQDLWRNAFGRSTRLRRERDAAELQSRRFTAYTQRQQLLIDTERIYWDIAFALKEEQIRSGNLDRSESLAKWVRDRVRKYAAESTDLLQIQALLSQRKLELLEARNRIADLKNQLHQLIPSIEPATFQPDLASLEMNRMPNALIATPTAANSGTPRSLVALSSLYRYNQAKAEVERTDDILRPLLQAYMSHGRNGIDSAVPSSWDRATSDANPATTIGLRLSLELDSDLKADRQKAAALAAEALALQSKAQARTSELEWSDLQRQIENLKAQAEEARKLARFNSRKSAEEQRRYRQGRTTAFQAITFETDAAASELKLYQLFSNLRKAESLARTFGYWEVNNL